MSKYVENLEKKVFELEDALTSVSSKYENLQQRFIALDKYAKQWTAFIKNDNYSFYTQYTYHTINPASIYYLIKKIGQIRKDNKSVSLTIGKRGELCWHVYFFKQKDDVWNYEIHLEKPQKTTTFGSAKWRDIVKFVRTRCQKRGIEYDLH